MIALLSSDFNFLVNNTDGVFGALYTVAKNWAEFLNGGGGADYLNFAKGLGTLLGLIK